MAEDTSKKPPAQAQDSIDQLISHLAAKDFKTKNDAIKQLGKLRHQKARDKLFEIAESVEWNGRLRITAIDMLGRGNVDKRFINLMNKIANDAAQDKEIRRTAITQLSRLRDMGSLDTLIKALDDEYRFIRFWAVRGLIKYKDRKAYPALIKALGDDDEEIRKEAQSHLELIGSETLPALIKAMKSSDGSKFMRYGIIGLLGRIDNPETVPPLIEALKDGNPRVITLAAMALGKSRNASAIKPLVVAYKNNEDRRRIISDALFHLLEDLRRDAAIQLVGLLNQEPLLQDLAKNLFEKVGTQSVFDLTHIQQDENLDPEIKDKIQEYLNSMQ
jgi:HEAT repeat protein